MHPSAVCSALRRAPDERGPFSSAATAAFLPRSAKKAAKSARAPHFSLSSRTAPTTPRPEQNQTHRSSYTLEGTKKQGITPKRRAKLLAKTREAAAAKSTPQ